MVVTSTATLATLRAHADHPCNLALAAAGNIETLNLDRVTAIASEIPACMVKIGTE
jgi:hypothetical protein